MAPVNLTSSTDNPRFDLAWRDHVNFIIIKGTYNSKFTLRAAARLTHTISDHPNYAVRGISRTRNNVTRRLVGVILPSDALPVFTANEEKSSSDEKTKLAYCKKAVPIPCSEVRIMSIVIHLDVTDRNSGCTPLS